MISSSTDVAAAPNSDAMASSSSPTAGLLRGRHIIRRVDGAGTPLVTDDGAIQFRDGIVVAIGGFEELARQHPDLPVLGDRETVIAPGFVNSHHHV
jgi:cytosine/adenosine deaminase-related metal-dependent hydrolase